MFSVSILIALAVLLLVILVGSREGLLASFLGPGDANPVDLENLQRSGKPNDFLICPEAFGTAYPDQVSPVFPVSTSKVKAEWLKVIARQPRTVPLDPLKADQLEFEQRSLLFRFPDLISVRFIPLDESRSTIAVYSRSRYGYSDLGVNRRRVLAWMDSLQESLRHD